ncbi:hypothetical protein [Methylobacterium sp. Leaf93]|uniref:hypothetical protein n=1 Tax=Methylobacterium sp. Leaf93 TaxID=1736249 RepID=UPI0006F7E153|nr:hypothetical protein [Methylobacterium sp. Leaf93]KQP05393.1 hypothetical protein ASF26_08065 [Methylobacterium sp. Leaf93]
MIDLEASSEEAVLFENADWRVIADGLEHRGTGYFIARDGLGRRSETGLWEWPLHLAEKSWCSLRPFREAFQAAADLFDVVRDEALAQSFVTGFGLRMGQGGQPGSEGFTKLAELVRPKSIARRRPAATDNRPSPNRNGAGRKDEVETVRAALS